MFRLMLPLMLATASASHSPFQTQMWLRLARAEVSDIEQAASDQNSVSGKKQALLSAGSSRVLPADQMAALPPDVVAELNRLRAERNAAQAQLVTQQLQPAVAGPAAAMPAAPGVSPMMPVGLLPPTAGPGAAPGAAFPGAFGAAPAPAPIPATTTTTTTTTSTRPMFEHLLPLVSVDAKLLEAGIQDIQATVGSVQNRLQTVKETLSGLSAASKMLQQGAQNDTNLANDNKAAFAKLDSVLAADVLDNKLKVKSDWLNQTTSKFDGIKDNMGNISGDVLVKTDDVKFRLYAKEPEILKRVDAVKHAEDVARLDVPEYVDQKVDQAVTNMIRAVDKRLALNLEGAAPAPAPGLFLAPGAAMMTPEMMNGGPVLVR